MTVTDDGTGLGPAAPPGRGLGLRLMRYRARSIGANLQWSRGPGGGTTVECIYAGNAYGDRPIHPARTDLP